MGLLEQLPEGVSSEQTDSLLPQQQAISSNNGFRYHQEIEVVDATNVDNKRILVASQQLDLHREIFKQIKEWGFPYLEIALFLPSLGLGGTLSSMVGKVKLDSCLGISFYIIVPMVSVICLTSYVFLKKDSIQEIKVKAQLALKTFPNLEKINKEEATKNEN